MSCRTISQSWPRAARLRRGMTLVEVMIVVVIVGVLGALAVYGVTRYIRAAQSTDAYAIINAIKGAQEVYRQDTFNYLDVSEEFEHSFPRDTPAPASKMAWAGTGDVADNFKKLGVSVDTGTYFVFACVAVRATVTMPPSPTQPGDFGLNGTPKSEPRFMVVAKADLDGDENLSYAVSHNFTNEIYTENEGD